MAGVSWKVMMDRLESIDLIEEARPIIQDTGHKIVARVKEQLYETGTDKYGKKLRNYKNSRYAKKKHQMNPNPGYGTPDLKLRGNLYQGLQVEDVGAGVRTYSNVSYFKYVESNFGTASFDMNQTNKIDYRKLTLYPELRKVIKQRTKTR